MNKLVKGAVATAAGIALLMGGAGTFAYWNSSVGVTGGTITAGNLLVADATPSDGVWSVQKDGTGTATTVANINAFVASPGDKLTYTKTVKVTATGNNLTAVLALTPGSIVAAPVGVAANDALAAYLTQTATITATGAGITAGTVAGTYNVAPGATGVVARDVTIAVVITFLKNGTAGFENNTKLGVVSLSGLAVSLNQQ